MAVVGSIITRYLGDTTGHEKAVDKVKKGNKSVLDQLKGGLGEDSAFGKTAKLLQGAGAVAGLSVAGKILSDATGKAVELRDALAAGGITSGQMADQLARSIPVLGNIYAAGRNIRELITGEEGIAKAIERAAGATDTASSVMVNLGKAIQQWREQSLKAVSDVERTIKGAGLFGLDKDLFTSRNSYEDRLKDIEKEKAARTAAIQQQSAELSKLTARQGQLREAAGIGSGKQVQVDVGVAKELAANDAAIKTIKAKLKKAFDESDKAEQTAIDTAKKLLGFQSGQSVVKAGGEVVTGWFKTIKEAAEQANKKLNDIAEKRKKENEDALKAQKEAAEQAKKDREEKAKQAQEAVKTKGEQLREQVATPEEKYSDKLKELRENYLAGGISRTILDRQIKLAKKELDEGLGKDKGVEYQKMADVVERRGSYTSPNSIENEKKTRDERAIKAAESQLDKLDQIKAALSGGVVMMLVK